jgi:hypothetical protein
MFELLLQTFWAKKKLCKKSADLHPRQGKLLRWNIFTGLNKTSFLLHKIGWRSAFFQHARSISMVSTGWLTTSISKINVGQNLIMF